MAGWSALQPLFRKAVCQALTNAATKRAMSGHGHRILPYQPSRWQWTKFKDLFHFYAMLGLIPIGAVIAYSNIFIGPATLSEIPEGYEPQHWEYYRHPITRFIARYVLNSPQQDYEKYLHYLYESDEKRRIRKLEKDIKAKMEERLDYQAYYYRPISGKYHRIIKGRAEEIDRISGD